MKQPVMDRTFESTLNGEEIALSLDQDSLIHLMNQFIDLYDDPEMAVLREYSTNAHDSHVAAGQTRPIEVKLPTSLEPILTIRDFGVGLSHDEIRDVYSKYGASTKRDSNDFNGTLGLGCKSGLAYSDQFTLVAVKDGLRNVAAVSRDESGAGHITIVEHDTPTDDDNGVTVQIPAKRHHTFDEKARKLFQYWPVGSVLVNDERPARFEGRRITDTLYLSKRESYYAKTTSVVVMGNVAYPFDKDWLNLDVGHEHDVTVFVPIGTVEFAPNREGLRDTTLNRKALGKIGQELGAHMLRAAQDDIDAADTAIEAMRRAAHWLLDLPSTVRPKAWAYRGAEMPDLFEAPHTAVTKDGEEDVLRTKFTVVPYNNRKVGQHERQVSVPFQTGCDAVWFYGYDLKYTTNHRRRLDSWHADVRPDVHTPRHYILTSEKPDMTYLDESRVFDWAEVKAVPLAREAHGENGRLIGSYDGFQPGSTYKTEILAADIDSGEAIFYWVGAQAKNRRWDTPRENQAKPWASLIREYEPDCTVIMLPETRLKKFLKQFPDAQEIKSAVQEHFDTWVVTLTEDQRKALAIHATGSDEVKDVRDFDGLAVDDPEITEAVRLANLDVATVLKRYQRFGNVGQDLTLPEWENPLDKYPLARRRTDRSYYFREIDEKLRKQHNIIYVNAVYAAASLEGDNQS